MKKNILISTNLELEINEICDIFLMNNKNRIKISQIIKLLKYKDPISYNNLNYFEVKKSFIKLFPLHKNNRKRNKTMKISKRNVELNKKYSDLKIKPSKFINIEDYGLSQKFFKEI